MYPFSSIVGALSWRETFTRQRDNIIFTPILIFLSMARLAGELRFAQLFAVKPDPKDNDDLGILHWAARSADTITVRILVQTLEQRQPERMDIYSRDINGMTALDTAVLRYYGDLAPRVLLPVAQPRRFISFTRRERRFRCRRNRLQRRIWTSSPRSMVINTRARNIYGARSASHE